MSSVTPKFSLAQKAKGVRPFAYLGVKSFPNLHRRKMQEEFGHSQISIGSKVVQSLLNLHSKVPPLYSPFYPPDDYFTGPDVFWNRDFPPPMIPVQDQYDSGACTAFALANIMYFNIWTSHNGLRLELSTQQLYNHFSIRKDGTRPAKGGGISFGSAALYITRCGLLTASQYPWKGNPTEKFVMPKPTAEFPVLVIRAVFEFLKEGEFKEQLLYSPIAASFKVSPAYKVWVREGSCGVFLYPGDTSGTDSHAGDTTEIDRHAVTIVGYGGKSNGPLYYIIQDSAGLFINAGFKKIERSCFTGGLIVTKTYGVDIESCEDDNYKILTHSR